MTLTKIQLRRAARAARKLASDFAEGRGPVISNSRGYYSCAAGVVAAAIGLTEHDAVAVDDLVIGALTSATSRYASGDTTAAIFPLLWAADELENAATRIDPETGGRGPRDPYLCLCGEPLRLGLHHEDCPASRRGNA